MNGRIVTCSGGLVGSPHALNSCPLAPSRDMMFGIGASQASVLDRFVNIDRDLILRGRLSDELVMIALRYWPANHSLCEQRRRA